MQCKIPDFSEKIKRKIFKEKYRKTCTASILDYYTDTNDNRHAIVLLPEIRVWQMLLNLMTCLGRDICDALFFTPYWNIKTRQMHFSVCYALNYFKFFFIKCCVLFATKWNHFNSPIDHCHSVTLSLFKFRKVLNGYLYVCIRSKLTPFSNVAQVIWESTELSITLPLYYHNFTIYQHMPGSEFLPQPVL